MHLMGHALNRRLRSTNIERPAQEALLNLMVAAGHVRERAERVFSEFGITHAQYNALRILKGGPPEGYPRGEIAERLIERAPDVTRLVDRLEKQGLAKRSRSGTDRRLALTEITAKGRAMLERMDPAVMEEERNLGRRLSRADCADLSRLCEQLYGPDVP
jgi:DNA-binding MarR family transcriptional regulator